MSGGIELEHRHHGERGRERRGDSNHHAGSSSEDPGRLRKEAEALWIDAKELGKAATAAYNSGDGAKAKSLSNQAAEKRNEAEAIEKRASDILWNSNNSNYTLTDDTIDLHGQQADETQRIMGLEIEKRRRAGRAHLHVIVGKGNHSLDNRQAVKPAVEAFCREQGLQYETDEGNAGRIYVNLQGGHGTSTPHFPQQASQHGGYGDQQQHGYQKPNHQQQQQQHQQHVGQNQQPQADQADELIARLVKKCCCAVM